MRDLDKSMEKLHKQLIAVSQLSFCNKRVVSVCSTNVGVQAAAEERQVGTERRVRRRVRKIAKGDY